MAKRKTDKNRDELSCCVLPRGCLVMTSHLRLTKKFFLPFHFLSSNTWKFALMYTNCHTCQPLTSPSRSYKDTQWAIMRDKNQAHKPSKNVMSNRISFFLWYRNFYRIWNSYKNPIKSNAFQKDSRQNTFCKNLIKKTPRNISSCIWNSICDSRNLVERSCGDSAFGDTGHHGW